MLLSLNWIREFCPFVSDETPHEIAARFSLHAAEVEGVEELGAALGEARAARVLAVRSHPAAERLLLVRVALGEERGAQAIEVVCGAPNVRAGLLVPYVAPGATIRGKTIRAAEVRGVLSPGMLCSRAELGAGDDDSGLWELPGDAAPGASLRELFPELRDVVLEVDNKSLTHRPDLWGHHGVAREFGAIYATELAPLAIDEELANAPGKSRITVRPFPADVGGAAGRCRRYCGLQIDGVRVGPSPAWLENRLRAIGSRPINNLVDVTNYILFELGQPLHAFDTGKVSDGEIRVRLAAEGERLRLLDDSEVALTPADLVIADAREPVALAGVMGGGGSEISDGTTSVFLESANFSPVSIRRTSVRFGKRTDSSLRFEKSLDPQNARSGILRAARMILDICPGARVVGPLQDVGFAAPAPIEIRTSASFIARRLGADLPADVSRGILARLGFGVDGDDAGTWTVTVPSWRATKDVSIEEDLVEEVGRIHGYDHIAPAAPLWPVVATEVNEQRLAERHTKQFLAWRAGLCEVYTYSMVGAEHCARFGLDPDAHLKLRNALSEDMDRLRREIVPLLLEKVRENQRYLGAFGLFELGRVYRKDPARLREPELPDERQRLAAVFSYEEEAAGNFYGVRRALIDCLRSLRRGEVDVVATGAGDPAARASAEVPPWAHPAVYGSVLVAGVAVGAIYRVHPRLRQTLELRGDVYAFDVDFDALLEIPRRALDYHPVSRYPVVGFDVAVVAPARTPVHELNAVLVRAAGELLRSIEVFDVFVLDGERKSVAFHIVFGSDDRTLSSEEVASLQDAVIAGVKDAGFALR